MERLFNIIPHAGIYEATGEDAADALVNFACEMDGDMNNYFYADDNSDVVCAYGEPNAVVNIIKNAMENKRTIAESMANVEIRGLKLAEIACVIEKINLLITMEIEKILGMIDESKIKEKTMISRCFDSENGKSVVCVDLVYDSSEELPLCDVTNICSLEKTEENIYFADELTKIISGIFDISSCFC